MLNVIAATVAIVFGMQHAIRDSAAAGPPHSCDTYECLVERLANANLDGLLYHRLYTVVGWGAALVSVVTVSAFALAAMHPFWAFTHNMIARLSCTGAQGEAALSTRCRTCLTHLQSLIAQRAARDDALDTLLSNLIGLRWLTASYMCLYMVVLAYFSLGSRAVGLREPRDPTRAVHTPQILIHPDALDVPAEYLHRAFVATLRVACDACRYTICSDKRVLDHLLTFFVRMPAHLSRCVHGCAEPHAPIPSPPPFRTTTRLHVEPCPAILRTAHARALYASHHKRHSGKTVRKLEPGKRSVGSL
eukprot:6189832-Pleurochrysis_carterae.AAC.2